MVDTPNLGLALPDEVDNINDEIFRLRDNLLLLDGIVGDIQLLLLGKAAAVHTHTLAQVSGLVEALADKMAASKTFALSDLTDVVGAANAPAGYLFARQQDGSFRFISSAAALGTHQHVVADIIDFDQNVTAQFTQIRGNAPANLNTLEKLAASLGNDTALNTTLRALITAASTAAANAQAAANNALNNANNRLATAGGFLYGALELQYPDPILFWHHPGVRLWYMQAVGADRLRVVDATGSREIASFKLGGDFLALGNLFAGNAAFQTNGNIYMPSGVWSQWGADDAFTATGLRIESRAQSWANERGLAWANDRVANLQYRLVTLGEQDITFAFNSGSTGSVDAPNGSVVVGCRQDGNQRRYQRIRYPQVYDPVRGWVGFSNA